MFLIGLGIGLVIGAVLGAAALALYAIRIERSSAGWQAHRGLRRSDDRGSAA